MSDLILENVVLSFANIFEPKSIMGGEPKFSASLIYDIADVEGIKSVQHVISAVAAEKWGQNVPSSLKVCLRSGAEKDGVDGYGPDTMFVSASSSSRPTVVNRDRTPVAKEDGVFYSGCRVNAIIRLWAQDNQYGKRVNAELKGLQFIADDRALGGGSVPVAAEDFPEVEELEDETADIN